MKNLNKKGYTFIELMAVIVILGIVMIITVSSVSYAFDDKREEVYNNEISMILMKAEEYGDKIINDIKDASNGITISVVKLAEKGYLELDEDGNITDPRNEKNNLNDLKIKIIYDESTNSTKAEMVS